MLSRCRAWPSYSRLSHSQTQRKKPKKKQQQLGWIEKLVDYEFRSMNLIQSESGTVQRIFELEKRQESQEDNKGLTQEEKNQLEECRDDVRKFDGKWWYHNRDYHDHIFNKPQGPYIRRFELYKNGYLTHTQEEVQNACKALGGCCAYDCGCCYKERVSVRMPGLFMHCRDLCDCCKKRKAATLPRDVSKSDTNKRACKIIIQDYCLHTALRKRV